MFNQETVDRLPVGEIRRLERVMELMAKFGVNLQTIFQSAYAIQHPHTWRYMDGTALDAVLEEYDKIAMHDGYSWTPPSERAV